MFIVPVVLLLPLKFLGLWMLAHGYWLGALGVLALAKMVSLGVTAFIFDLTRPKLLQLAWFRWLYERVMAWLGLGARAGRSDQAPAQDLLSHVRAAGARAARCDCSRASAGACRRRDRGVQTQVRAAGLEQVLHPMDRIMRA